MNPVKIQQPSNYFPAVLFDWTYHPKLTAIDPYINSQSASVGGVYKIQFDVAVDRASLQEHLKLKGYRLIAGSIFRLKSRRLL